MGVFNVFKIVQIAPYRAKHHISELKNIWMSIIYNT